MADEATYFQNIVDDAVETLNALQPSLGAHSGRGLMNVELMQKKRFKHVATPLSKQLQQGAIPDVPLLGDLNKSL